MNSPKFTPKLEFFLNLPPTPINHLIQGSLVVRAKSETTGIKLQATSGCRGHQYQSSWTLKGKGELPPTATIYPASYYVSTQRLWMPNVKGVEGSFYCITPFTVKMGNVTRGDFGVHFDANVPGSAGCIVIGLQDHWDTFRKLIAEFRASGFQQIPLSVNYYQAIKHLPKKVQF